MNFVLVLKTPYCALYNRACNCSFFNKYKQLLQPQYYWVECKVNILKLNFIVLCDKLKGSDIVDLHLGLTKIGDYELKVKHLFSA